MGLTYPQPNNDVDFEEFCLRFYRKQLQRESLVRYGKRGERQFGVDICDLLNMPPIVAIQCKHHEPTKPLTVASVQAETEKAQYAPISIEKFIVATSARKSRETQDEVIAINGSKKFKFVVEVHFWEDICSWLDGMIPLLALEIVYGRNIFDGGTIDSKSRSHTSIATSFLPVQNESRVDDHLAFQSIERLLEERKVELARYELEKISAPTVEAGFSADEVYAWHRLRGKLDIESGDFLSASSHFLIAYDACPEKEQAKQNRVLALELRGERNNAYELATQLVADGLHTSRLAALIVQTVERLEDLQKHQFLIDRYAEFDENLNISLAHRFNDAGDFEAARGYAEQALKLQPQSPQSHFAMGAAHHMCAVNEPWAGVKEQLKKAIQHYTLALQFAEEQHYDRIMEVVLCNRGIAKHLLGMQDAGDDFRAAVRRLNSQSSTAERAIEYFLSIHDVDSAWELLGNLNAERLESRYWKAATESAIGDDQKRRDAARELLALANLEWKRAVESRCLAVQTAILIPDFALAEELASDSEGNELQLPLDMVTLTLQAWIAHEDGDKSRARDLCAEATACVPKNPELAVVRILAQLHIQLGDDESGLLLYELIVRPGRLDEDCRALIRAAQRCRRDDVLLRICEELRVAQQQDEQLRRIQIQLLSQYSPERALDLCREFEGIAESPKYFLAWRNVNALLLNRPEEMNLQREFRLSPGELSPKESRIVVLPLVATNQYIDAIDFLYRQLLSFPDMEAAHGVYIATFLQFDDKLTIELRPDKVDEGCAALVEDENADRQWIGIDSEYASPSRGWFAASDSIAEAILGKGVGALVQYPGAFIRGKSGVIREVQSKYLRMFQDSIEHFQSRFPGSSVIQQVPVIRDGKFDPTLIVETLKQRRDHVQHCLKVYRESFCALYFLGEQLGLNEYETLKAITKGEHRFVRCCCPSRRASNIDIAENARRSWVIDMSAICTMSHFDLWPLLDEGVDLQVARTTIEVIRSWIAECKDSKATGFVALDYDGLPLIVDKSDEDKRKDVTALEQMLTSVLEHCRISTSDGIAGISPKSRDLYLEVIGFHNVETICIAKDTGAVIWCDDFLTGLVAETDFSVPRIWTQFALQRLGLRQPGELNKVAAKLCAANYVNTIWGGETLVAAGELAEWDASASPSKECVELLSRRDINVRVRAKIVREFLRALRRSACPPFLQTQIIQRVLNGLNNSGATRWVRSELDSTFGLDVVSADFVRLELDYWLAHNR